jgi:hypothetical protein
VLFPRRGREAIAERLMTLREFQHRSLRWAWPILPTTQRFGDGARRERLPVVGEPGDTLEVREELRQRGVVIKLATHNNTEEAIHLVENGKAQQHPAPPAVNSRNTV